MGQGQSSDQPVADLPPAKADYYDLLGIERTATDDELKKAYRRKALELHPDRNYGNVDETTKLFAEIQTAYEVLSDPQERAWYDSHKDILLRGDQAGANGEEFSYNIRMTTAVEVQQMMLRFNGRMEFSDAPSGFYGGLHEFFAQLAKEEDIACQWEDLDPLDYPYFGHKDDVYEDVVRPFYSAWTGFATKKSFSWKDSYRLADAPDRRIRRLMEKENKKIRDEAIQEYNDSIRSLVVFVRKRDPRVQNNQKSEAERQKVLRDAAAAQAARSRRQRDAQLRNALNDPAAVPDWAQSREKDEHEGGFSSESEIEEHEYDCVVCDKTFKSEAQFKAHEKSKKHVKLLKQLKRDMREEDDEFQESGLQTPQGDEEPEEEVDAEPDHKGPESDKTGDDDDDAATEPESIQPHKLVTNRHATSKATSDQSEAESEDDNDYASREAIEARIAGTANALGTASLDDTPATSDTDPNSATPKLGKAKQKRAKKAAAQAAGDSKAASSSAEHRCARCGNEFESKTQLFKHLKDNPSHAALKAAVGGAKKGSKGKKR